METRVNVEEGKKYLYVETTEEGIKQFKNAPEAERMETGESVQNGESLRNLW